MGPAGTAEPTSRARAQAIRWSIAAVLLVLLAGCSVTIEGAAQRASSGSAVSSTAGHDEGAAPADRPAASEGDGAAEKPGAGPESAEPYVVKGRATRSDGTPLQGATVIADNTLMYDSNALAVTGADGRYRIELPSADAFTWRVYVGIDVPFDGQQFHIDLAMDSDDPFASADGAVRNATWQLTGPHPGNPDLVYGGRVYFYEDLDHDDLYGGYYRVFFSPTELIDGSTMDPFILESGEGEDWIDDIPLGRYEVVVAYVFTDGRPAVQLGVRPRNTGDYAQSAAAGFRADTSQPLMEFDVIGP